LFKVRVRNFDSNDFHKFKDIPLPIQDLARTYYNGTSAMKAINKTKRHEYWTKEISNVIVDKGVIECKFKKFMKSNYLKIF